MDKVYYDSFRTRMGWVTAVLSETGLKYTSLSMSKKESWEKIIARLGYQTAMYKGLPEIRSAINHFFTTGEHLLNTIVLDMGDLSPFLRIALEICRTIPMGETRSYAWIANRVGSPFAYRSIGQAMAKNPLPIVVPCHRVIGSDGRLVGYTGGLDLKVSLLNLERSFIGNRDSLEYIA